MADPVAAAFGRPFPEQVAAFRLRLADLRPTAAWDDLRGQEHDRAFMVAGAVKADLLADLAGAVDKAIAGGGTLEQFRKDFRGIVEKHGWHGWTGEGTAAGEAWWTRVIYRTNMSTSYAAGRHAQLTRGRYRYWVYRHGGSEHPRLHHLSWDGVALPPDHPFWASHYPPNGWGCSCRVHGARTRAGIRRVGGDPDKVLPPGWEALDRKTGAPRGIDKGWDHAPGRTVVDEVNRTLGAPSPDPAIRQIAEKLPRLPAMIGSNFGEQVAPRIEDAWSAWVEEVASGKSHRPGLAGVISPDILTAISRAGVAAPASAEIMVAPGLLHGPKQRRHEAVGNAIDRATWLILPRLITSPRSVMLDVLTDNLLYLLDGGMHGTPQLALSLDYRTRIQRSTITTNMVVSAYIAMDDQLRARVAAGKLHRIWWRNG